MKIISRYITLNFLVTFLISLVVLTFVMSIGAVFRISDLLARGAAWRPILSVFLSLIPFMLTFALPVSALVSSLLVFGRLSADGETMAMRACGISLAQIVRGPVMVSFLLVLICLYVNDDLAPRSHYVQRTAASMLGLQSPLELLEEGRFIQDFEGLTLYVGRKKGRELIDVRIADLRNPNVKRQLRAATGAIRAGTNRTELVLDLFDVRIDPFYDDRPGAGYCGHWTLTIGGGKNRKTAKKKEADMSFGELFVAMDDVAAHAPGLPPEDLPIKRMNLTVELNKRLALSFSCLSFVLLGIPLGIKSHRKESSIGIGISFLLAFGFYIFIVMGEALVQRPEVRPDLIIWVPVVISLIVGPYLLKRAD